MVEFLTSAEFLSFVALVAAAGFGFGAKALKDFVAKTDNKVDDKVYNAFKKALDEAGEIPEDPKPTPPAE